MRSDRRVATYMSRHYSFMPWNGQVAIMVFHNDMQLIAAMKHVGAMVSPTIEMAMTPAVRPNVPDVGVAADENNVGIHCCDDIHVAWRSDVFGFGHDGRTHDHRRRRHRLIRDGHRNPATGQSDRSGESQCDFERMVIVHRNSGILVIEESCSPPALLVKILGLSAVHRVRVS